MSTTPDNTRPAVSGMSRRLKAVLIGSLAVNLLVIGAIGGSLAMRGFHGRWHHGHGPESFGLLGFSHTLPAERRKMIRDSILADRGNLRPLFRDTWAARREAADALVADPFDRDAFRAAIGKVGAAMDKIKSAGLDRVVATVEKLTPQERTALRDWWRKSRPHHFGRGPGGPDDGPPDDGPPEGKPD